ANSYHSFCRAMIDATPAGDQTTAWLVADHAFVRRYGLGFAKPGPMPLFPYLRSGYLKRGATLQELAHAAGSDPAGLSHTITPYNAAARSGEDPQFGRGTNAYNAYLGDQTHKPNSCVAPLERGPFYAVQVFVGDLGTFAGLHVD